MAHRSPELLRRALYADALASGAVAVLLVAGAEMLEPVLGLSVAFMRGAGAVLIPYVAFVVYVATRATFGGAWWVVVANALWAVASVLSFRWISPALLGTLFVLGQAGVVAMLGMVQMVGLRRIAPKPRSKR